MLLQCNVIYFSKVLSVIVYFFFQASTFSKCTMCTTIERYMEKKISVTERAEYRRLKDEHNERQM